MHRPTGDDAAGIIWPVFACVMAQAPDEDFHEVFEALPLAEDDRALEERACRKGLDGLQETAVAGIVDELLDSRVPGLHLQRRSTELGILHEGERGAHAIGRAGAAGQR